MEQYARITDCPNYAISTFGDVLSIKKQKILKSAINGAGYLHVILCDNGIRKNVRVHRLVAEAFLDNPNNYEMIDHIDRNRTNNNIDNLRWVDRSQNNRNKEKRGCIHKCKNWNSWRVEIRTRGEYYSKAFKSLEEATKHLQEKLLELDTDI